MAKASRHTPQYVRIAEILIGQMERGVLRPSDRAPSLRKLSQQQRVSVTTALQSYMWLENRGYLEARARSGFFVRQPFAAEIPEPKFEAGSARERKLGMDDILSDVFRTANDPANLGFGAGCASPELFAVRRLNLNLRRIVHREPARSSRYDFPPDFEQLRRQIARRVSYLTSGIAPGDIVITSGALEAVTLGLRAVARPGDAVAVESPTYFGILAGIASIGLGDSLLLIFENAAGRISRWLCDSRKIPRRGGTPQVRDNCRDKFSFTARRRRLSRIGRL